MRAELRLMGSGGETGGTELYHLATSGSELGSETPLEKCNSSFEHYFTITHLFSLFANEEIEIQELK